MEQFIEYPGPSPEDYANVQALNSAFIKAVYVLKSPQRGRLAATPFLLCSFRENDLDWWNDALADAPQRDFMDEAESMSPALARVQSAALSFLWQLGRRNPYVARIVAGVSISWCEKITELPLVALLERAGSRADLIAPRLIHPVAVGDRLLCSGTSSKHHVRRSSQLCALQSVLTSGSSDRYSRLPAAACRVSGFVKTRDKKV